MGGWAEDNLFRRYPDVRTGGSTSRGQHLSPALSTWLAAVDADDEAAAEQRLKMLAPSDAGAVGLIYIAARREDEAAEAMNRRWWCMRALGALAGPAEATVLMQMLHEPVSDLRAGAVVCVADVVRRNWETDRGLAELLLGKLMLCLVDDAALVRQTAADALAQLGKIALPSLWQTLQQKNQSGRTRAAYALRRMRLLDAAPYLYRLLEDGNPMVNLYAREGLDDLGLLDMTYYRP